MYKLVAIDLDGTLLNSFGEISQRNLETLRKVIDSGVEVVLASGRPIASIKYFSNLIGRNNFLISGNGATVYDIKNDEIVYENFLTKKKLLNIVDVCEENSIYYNIYFEDVVVTKNLNYNTLFYYKENQHKEEDKRTRIAIIPDVRDYVLNSNSDRFLKVTVCDQSEIIFNSIIKKLKNISGLDVLDVSHMSRKIIESGSEEFKMEYFYTEITNENVNKWTAIEKLIEKLEINKDEVLTIGDNVNDNEMVAEAGFGVAMGNSNPHLKEISDFITSDNNSDGVSDVLEKMILN